MIIISDSSIKTNIAKLLWIQIVFKKAPLHDKCENHLL